MASNVRNRRRLSHLRGNDPPEASNSDAGGGIIDPGNACLGRRKTLLALLGLTVVFVVVLAVIVSSVGRSSDVIDVQDSVDAPKVAASRLIRNAANPDEEELVGEGGSESPDDGAGDYVGEGSDASDERSDGDSEIDLSDLPEVEGPTNQNETGILDDPKPILSPEVFVEPMSFYQLRHLATLTKKEQQEIKSENFTAVTQIVIDGLKDLQWLVKKNPGVKGNATKEKMEYLFLHQQEWMPETNLEKFFHIAQNVSGAYEEYLGQFSALNRAEIISAVDKVTYEPLGRDARAPLNTTEVKMMKIENLRTKLISPARSDSAAPRDSFGDLDERSLGFISPTSCVSDTELRCTKSDGCFAKTEQCDRWVNCLDNSDETDCSCKQYLPLEKICDGYPDCPLGEDEKSCPCAGDSVQCGFLTNTTFPKCVQGSVRCDNIRDCGQGEDEVDCFALSNPVLERKAYGGQDSGVLHVRTDSGWSVLSIELGDASPEETSNYLQQLSNHVCRSILSGTDASMDMPYTRESADKFSQVAHLRIDLSTSAGSQAGNLDGGRYSYVIGPPYTGSVVISVDCGDPLCGVRSVSSAPDAAPQPGSSRPRVGTASQPEARNADSVRDEYTAEDNGEDSSIQERIVGGDASRPQSWPFIVALYRDGIFVCGATIISRLWIVTAAHCLMDFDKNAFFFQVFAGTIRRSSNSPTRFLRTVEEVHIYEQYNADSFIHDIALAKVDSPFIFSKAASRACLPDKSILGLSTKPAPRVGDKCFALGWGSTEEVGLSSDDLREVVIPINETCQFSANNVTVQVCGGYQEGGKDSCQGDSGGPLFCTSSNRPDRWYLAGVISHGLGCARPGELGVYTRVQFYMDWISKVTSINRNRVLPTNAATVVSSTHKANPTCKTVTCDNGRCLPKAALCNFFVDCFDGTDERNCTVYSHVNRTFVPPQPTTIIPVTTTTTAVTAPTKVFPVSKAGQCPEGMFRCSNSYQCIPTGKVCNKVLDCVDGSDERRCTCRDYLATTKQYKICDGYPDCPDWSDELGCSICGPTEFLCSFERECIPISKVCDQVIDCSKQGEDERYCMTLVNGDSVPVGKDGHPITPNKGLIAIQQRGIWRPLCVDRWDNDINDQFCRYVYKRASLAHRLMAPGGPNYPTVLLDVPLKTTLVDSSMSGRSAVDTVGTNTSAHSLESRSGSTRSKRSVSDRPQCSFVEATCTSSPPCGVLPLLLNPGQIPEHGIGTHPWQVTLYKEGSYICGATLVHRSWFVTHFSCAKFCDPTKDYCVARMGGFDVQSQFQSAVDQFRRVERYVQLHDEAKEVVLGKLEVPAELNEFVNTLCIPSQPWIPIGAKCYMSGKSYQSLKDGIPVTLRSVCDRVNDNDYKLCTDLATNNFCMEKWSGALSCPDGTGKFYAVGLYYTEMGGCGDRTQVPSTFLPLSTVTIRDNIAKIISGASSSNVLEDTGCTSSDPAKPRLRCPQGECLDSSKICDGSPDCGDMSDESPSICRKPGRQCLPINSTHCTCLTNELKCGNGMCIDKANYCNGKDDCGDGSDEPDNCNRDCVVDLLALDPSKICDGKIDCLGEEDLAADESAALCCPPGKTFRCVTGIALPNDTDHLEMSNECIDSSLMCDNIDQCSNGADEQFCLFVKSTSAPPKKDAFGRYMTETEGYVYMVIRDIYLVYCGWPKMFQPDSMLTSLAEVYCVDVLMFSGFEPLKVQKASERHLVGSGNVTTAEEWEDVQNCVKVYMICKNPRVPRLPPLGAN